MSELRIIYKNKDGIIAMLDRIKHFEDKEQYEERKKLAPKPEKYSKWLLINQ
jgi:hypothetical protein